MRISQKLTNSSRRKPSKFNQTRSTTSGAMLLTDSHTTANRVDRVTCSSTEMEVESYLYCAAWRGLQSDGRRVLPVLCSVKRSTERWRWSLTCTVQREEVYRAMEVKSYLYCAAWRGLQSDGRRVLPVLRSVKRSTERWRWSLTCTAQREEVYRVSK